MRSNLPFFLSQDKTWRTDGEGPTDRGRERETREIIAATWDRETREGGSLFCVAGHHLFARVANPSLLPFLSLFAVLDFPKKVEGKTTGAQKVLLYWWYQQKRGKTFFSSLLAAARRSRLAKKDEEVATKKKSKEKLSRKARKGYCSRIHFVALGSAVRSPAVLAVLCLELAVCFFRHVFLPMVISDTIFAC